MDLARLSELLRYDPRTGTLTWKVSRRGYRGIKAGDAAGTVHSSSAKSSYKSLRIMIDQRWYEAHRVAWVLHFGSEIPEGLQIDHINGDATDNRIANLRLASRKQNMENAKLHAHNSSGYRGVSWDASRNRWMATVSNNGKKKNLGRFATKEEAIATAITARSNLYTHYTGREIQ